MAVGSRSSQIRMQAREQLARLRAERRRDKAKRDGAVSVFSDVISTRTMVEERSPVYAEVPTEEPEKHAQTPETDVEHLVEEAAAAPSNHPAPVTDTETQEDSSDAQTDPPEEAVSAEPPAETPTTETTDDAVQSDLLTLPGAGPGLIWMLNSCGISTLAELAQSDIDKLKSDMGLVAKILDVDFWVTFAREATTEHASV